jgi:predicted Zn-dependent peptidase
MTETIVVKTLANGLRVVADPMPVVETAAVGVWVNVGARHEPVELHGISHLLEHMAFKGTSNRTARDIAETIEAVGGYLNAFTSREQTAYYARVLKADVPLAVSLLSDILRHSTFDETELAREHEVIVQEIGEAQDTPDDLVFDHLQEAAYPGQVLGRSILGTPDSVRAINSRTLREYLNGHYGASEMVLVGSGAIDPNALFDLAERWFGDWPAGARNGHAKAVFSPGERRETRKLEQTHLALAFDGVAYDDPFAYVSQVYATVLGGGMSSRLFQEAREKRGLCYSIFAYAGSMVDGGSMGVYAGTGPKDASDLMSVVAEQMHALAQNADEVEVARARAQLKAGLLMGLESPSQRAEQIARQILIFGRPVPTQELIAKVDAVDADLVRRFGTEIVGKSKPAFAALGPISKLESYDRIAARFA